MSGRWCTGGWRPWFFVKLQTKGGMWVKVQFEGKADLVVFQFSAPSKFCSENITSSNIKQGFGQDFGQNHSILSDS